MKRYKNLFEGFSQSINGLSPVQVSKLSYCKGDHKIENGKLILDGEFSAVDMGLVTLEGSPDIVKGGYYIYYNDFRSIKGCAQEIGGNFNCCYCGIESLIGGPRYVGENYECHTNKLTTLEGMATEIGGDIDVSHNELKSLKGLPSIVHGTLEVASNNLRDLVGMSKLVKLDFYVSDNRNLRSFFGMGKVLGNFVYNNCINLDPREVELIQHHRKVFDLWIESGLRLDEYEKTDEYKYEMTESRLDKDMRDLWQNDEDV